MSVRHRLMTSSVPLPKRGARWNAVLLMAGVALLTASALIRVPMWPVPMTMQTWAVLLIGASYRAPLGALTMVAYIALAALGAPILAGGAALTLGGPTFGYLVGFVLSAVAMGWMARLGWTTRGWLSQMAVLSLGQALIYLSGLAWLQFAWLHDIQATLNAGLLPFLVGDAVKLLLACALLRSTRAFQHVGNGMA